MINADREPKVILSASGMCEAGRIRHHLKHNLWRPECTILFVGYQAVGTLGRTLIEGATDVKLFGEAIEVRAEICQLTGLSGHADKNGLLAWVNAFSPKPKRVFIVHGDDEVENIFAQTLTDETLALLAQHPSALLERLARHLLRMQTIVYVGLLLVRNARRDGDRLALAKAFVRHHLPDLHAARQAVLLACEDLA